MPPIHIHPTAPLSERVLLPGDPGRALRLAQELLETPKMFNHNRGLWGYTGTAGDGRALTIQSTGIGGPSIAIVASELIELGARRLLRTGTCGALRPEVALGQLLVATEAIADDGTSRSLGAGERIEAGDRVSSGLLGAGGAAVVSGPVVSTDLFYDDEDRRPAWLAAGAVAVEMEAAALFAIARRRGAEAGCILVVSDLLTSERVRIAPNELHEGELRMGTVALAALG